MKTIRRLSVYSGSFGVALLGHFCKARLVSIISTTSSLTVMQAFYRSVNNLSFNYFQVAVEYHAKTNLVSNRLKRQNYNQLMAFKKEREQDPPFWFFHVEYIFQLAWSPKYSTVKILHLPTLWIFLNIHWKDWWWSWSSNTLATWCKAPIHLKRP